MEGQDVLEANGVTGRMLGDRVANVKISFATRAVPPEEMAGVVPVSRAPRLGDLAVAEVVGMGRHKTLEINTGVTMYLFPGDRIVGAFGHRYATDQYEGYVPEKPAEECDLLSVGGVLGKVTSKHTSMPAPTRLRVLGLVAGHDGRPLNQRDFGLSPLDNGGGGEVILVVGSAMNAGKTTTAGTLARALSRAGLSVAAAKVTGTAAGRDARFFESCGARPVFDFTAAGYPSTYMVGSEDLLDIYNTLLGHMRAAGPDYVIVEVADGVLQRETRMMLESEEFRSTVDHVFFAATDGLSAATGVRLLQGYGLPLRATAGAVTQSLLSSQEAEKATGLPSLSTERIMDGTLQELLGSERAPERDRVYAPGAVGESV